MSETTNVLENETPAAVEQAPAVVTTPVATVAFNKPAIETRFLKVTGVTKSNDDSKARGAYIVTCFTPENQIERLFINPEFMEFLISTIQAGNYIAANFEKRVAGKTHYKLDDGTVVPHGTDPATGEEKQVPGTVSYAFNGADLADKEIFDSMRPSEAIKNIDVNVAAYQKYTTLGMPDSMIAMLLSK